MKSKNEKYLTKNLSLKNTNTNDINRKNKIENNNYVESKIKKNSTLKSQNSNYNYKNKLTNTILDNRIKNIEKSFINKLQDNYIKIDEKKQMELEASLGWLFYTDQLKKKIREKIQNSLRLNDLITIILAISGIFFNIFASSMFISFTKTWNEDNTLISINIISNKTNLIFFLRILTSISTLLLLYFLFRHYCIRLKYDIFKQKCQINSTFYSTGLIWKLFIDWLLCCIHSPPFFDDIKLSIMTISGETISVHLDFLLSSLIPLRVYLLFRYYSFYSSWADDRAEKICNECNTLGGISFAIKAELKERPYTVVGILMILSILIFGYALRNVELSFMKDQDSLKFQDWTYVWNGFWCIMITILTVGYGDFYPQTTAGRIIAVIACIWGTFLISLMVVSLTISVEFTSQEQKAYAELKKVEIYSDLKTKALNLIRYSIRFKNFPEKREQIKDPEIKLKYIKLFDQFKNTLNEFSISRKFVMNREHESSAENILYKLNENVGYEMENIIHISSREVNTLLNYLKLSNTIQDEIETYIEKLDKMTEGLINCLENNESYENEDFETDKLYYEIMKNEKENINEIEEKNLSREIDSSSSSLDYKNHKLFKNSEISLKEENIFTNDSKL